MTPRLSVAGSGPLVAHVVHSLEVGGLENGLVNIVNQDRGAFRHLIVCLERDGALRARLRPGVEVRVVGKRKGHDLRAFVRLVRLLRQARPAVVHSRNWAAFDAVVAARVAGVPIVVHSEHGREMSDPEGRNWRRNWVRRRLGPLISRFVTVSDDLGKWLVSVVGVPERKVVTIHNGVDVRRFGGHDRPAVRVRFGLPMEAVIVGTVGRLDPVKDQAGLIRAFVPLAQVHPEALMVIVGDGPCRRELEGIVAGLGLRERVRLLGVVSDVPAILGALDVFVLPSIAEGMSNTILEAMASSLPVVATRVGGSPEMVEDGVTGTLVPARDAEALRKALGIYLEDESLRTIHGKAARQRSIDLFSLERMGSGYMGLYAELLAGQRERDV
jgi:sugar transferase (PEP-CTERM/EpsH1 system associated)